MARVLLMSGGTQGLIMARSLSEKGHDVLILSKERHNYAEDSSYVKKLIIDEDGEYDDISSFTKLVKDQNVDVIIPMSDDYALFTSEHIKKLKGVTNIKMPSIENFMLGYDKNKLMMLCQRKGYPHPLSYDLASVDIESDDIRNMSYPVMLKPNCTTGGRGMVQVFSYQELKDIYPGLHEKYGDYHVQRYVKSGGRQVKIQLYIDESKQLVASTVMQKLRWYPNKGGSNCCAVSVEDNQIVDICYNILKDINWVGFADFDAIEDPDTGELLIMEINPRVPACIKLPIVCGVDWAEIIYNGYMNIPQRQYKYKLGVILRHLGLDILWIKNAENKIHTQPNWFRFFGKNIYYQDMGGWHDWMPFVMGTYHNIKKLFSPDFKQTKGI